MYLKKAVRGTIIVLFLAVLSGGFSYLLRLILARQLSVAEYGLFYSVLTVFLLIGYIIDSGMGLSVSRVIIELRIAQKFRKINDIIFSVAAVQFVISALISIIMILAAGFLSKNYFHGDAQTLILYMAIWILSLPLLTTYTTTFYGFSRVELFSLVDTLRSFLVLVITLLFLMLGLKSNAPALAYAAASFLLIFGLYFLVRKIYTKYSLFGFKFDKAMTIEAFKFGIIVSMSSLIWTVITQADTMVVTYFTNPTQVALYQIAVPTASILLYLTNALSLVIYPLASELQSRKEHLKLSTGLSMVYKYLVIILLPMVVMMIAFPDIIINILFTSKYLGAAPALQILSVSAVFLSITAINNSALTALGNPKTVAKSMAIIAGVNIILNVIFVPLYGIIGAAYSTLASFIIAAVLSSIQLRKIVPLKYPLIEWLALLIMSVLMILFTNLLRNTIILGVWPKLIIVGSILVIAYLAVLLLSRIIRISDIKFWTNTIIGAGKK